MIDFLLGSTVDAEPVFRSYIQPAKTGFLLESPNGYPENPILKK